MMPESNGDTLLVLSQYLGMNLGIRLKETKADGL